MATYRPLVLLAGMLRRLQTGDTLSPDSLPPATTTALGAVIAGSGLTVAGDGTLSTAAASSTSPTRLFYLATM